jgi:hypothetical protein
MNIFHANVRAVQESMPSRYFSALTGLVTEADYSFVFLDQNNTAQS